MTEVAALTLANICLDVQIGICMFLHPSDILALRKTCKALQPSTRQRVVWVAALHRVCIDNTLFLPSFPISDMSDMEIENAAMGPRRWIELCGAFEKQHLNDPGAILCPRATRIINDSFTIDDTQFFIVPGGRYLVRYLPGGHGNISVLDLGYTSSARADYKLIASVGLERGYDIWSEFRVQATPDGMGLTIFSSNANNCSVYEIYPQSETPHLTQIARLDFDPSGFPPPHLLPGTVIWFKFYEDRTIFWVWDYRLNHSVSFSVDVDCKIFMATKTTVILICELAVLIWAIPSLLPQPPNFFDHSPTHIPTLFTIPFPDSIELASELIRWNTISSWYFGSSQPLYFDALCQDSKLHRFQIRLKPDLSIASLHVINTSELTPHDFNHVAFQDYWICEDTLVSCWFYMDYDCIFRWDQCQCGVYTGLTSARFSNFISHGGPAAKILLPDIGRKLRRIPIFCAASGRFVRLDSNNSLAVLDLF